MSTNLLADKLTAVALRQLQISWLFKQPRITKIRDFRRLYNTQLLPKLRTQFNVPLPVFSGMIDTLQADLNDTLVIKYGHTDPADWKAVEKLNSAIEQESTDMRPGAKWAGKFREYRFEKIITGRGIAKHTAGNDGGFHSEFEVVTFEDFFFEPTGGKDLDNHLFCGQQNIWRSAYQLKEGADNGIYDKKQVETLISNGGGSVWKRAGLWDSMHDIGNRFSPLNLNAETNNYVGEVMFGLVEWVLTYEGKRWRILFEPYTGIWVQFEKNIDLISSDALPWISSASHPDSKNFASKGFSDDLYPVADSIITLFNQDLTNRQKRNLNAKAYDREMFKDVGKLDEAQYRPDALVPADTKNGAKRISEGIFAFETPALTGTVDLIEWLEADTGKNLGVTDLQQGGSQAATKKVGVTFAELGQISKRLEFTSAPFQEMGMQLGDRFLAALKDYMTEPIAIQLLGENGIEWDVLKRIDLNTKRALKISVSAKGISEARNDVAASKKTAALGALAMSPNINQVTRDEMVLREAGFTEADIAILMDTSNHTDKETMAEVSAAIQEIVLRGKMPKTNYNADLFFLKRLANFAKQHQDTLSKKKFDMLIEYMNMHQQIAADNAKELATAQVAQEQRAMQMAGNTGGAPVNTPLQ